jgi:DNA invertase Pin-like site-specific DNA recombinase
MFVRAYLRASTKEQDATRAKNDLIEFAKERGLQIAAFYVEHESGASLQRPELFRLLSDCHEGDLCLIEQVDRLSRLNAEDWNKLKAELQSRRVRVVALDLPTVVDDDDRNARRHHVPNDGRPKFDDVGHACCYCPQGL